MRRGERERARSRCCRKKRAHGNNVGGARSSVPGRSGKYFQVQRRSRLLKTRPSSNDGGEVIGSSLAHRSLLAARRLPGVVDLHFVSATAQHSSARTFAG